MAKSAAYDAAAGALGGDKEKKRGKPKVHKVEVRRGHAGGYIAEHHMKHDDGAPAEGPNPEYPLRDMADLHQHLDQHMGDDPAAAAAAPASEGDPKEAVNKA